MNIAIVDDERIQQVLISQMINKWSKQINDNVKIKTYDSAEGFLFNYEADSSVDILLLDIQMKAMDGLALAKEIRKQDEHMQIIFITGIPDFIAEGYEVSALHYLMKPLKEAKLFEVMDRAVIKLQVVKRTILFQRVGGNVRIKAEDILYAEVASHTVTLHLLNGEESFVMRLADVEKLLGDGFFRCHRSYIVSMSHVCRVTKTAMLLDNGKGHTPLKIPLSRNLYDEANQAFIKFN